VTIEQLSKKLWALHTRHLRRKAAYRKALEADQKAACEIEERHKALMQMVVGVDDGVQLAVRSGSPQDDSYGTLLKVNRTRCIVLIDGREWDISIELVAVSTAAQRNSMTSRVWERPAGKVKQVVLSVAVLAAIGGGALNRPMLN